MANRMMHELGWDDDHPILSSVVVVVSSIFLVTSVVVLTGVWLTRSLTGR